MVAAFILMEAASGAQAADAKAAHEAAHKIPGVKTVHFVLGPTDAIAYVEAADLDGLTEIITKLRGVKGIARTDTCIVMPL